MLCFQFCSVINKLYLISTFFKKCSLSLYEYITISTISGNVSAMEVVDSSPSLINPPWDAVRRRQLNSGIDYVHAIIEPYILKDYDVLPLQQEAYQTDRVTRSICTRGQFSYPEVVL